jgi:hypothetical protein
MSSLKAAHPSLVHRPKRSTLGARVASHHGSARLWRHPDPAAASGPICYATLSLYPRSQGESAEWQIEHGTRLIYHVTDQERYYYRGAYMDCVRGIDFE